MHRKECSPLKYPNNPVFRDFLAQIEGADDFELNEIIQAVIHRYQSRFPDEDVIFLSLPHENLIERSMYIDVIMDFLDNHKLQ